MNIEVFIEGVPYSQRKARGDLEAPLKWTKTVVERTRDLPKIKGPCKMSVLFTFPEDKFPADFPYGPDIDNCLKRLCDALGQTIFSDARGADSAIVDLRASKRKASECEQTGARVVIQELGTNWNNCLANSS